MKDRASLYDVLLTELKHRKRSSLKTDSRAMMLIQSLASKVTSSEIDSSKEKVDSVVSKLFPSSPDAKQQGLPPLYWYSTEARKLFAPNLSEEVSLFEHLKERILKFDAALNSGNQFNDILEPDLQRGD
jgi:hypothetical protein